MNANKLKAKIIENGLNVEGLAKLIGITKSSMYRKLNNSQRITICEASQIKEVLKMTDEEATQIFFD